LRSDFVQARLEPLALFVTEFVIGKSVAQEITLSRDEVSSANGAAPPKPKPRPRKKTRKGIRPCQSIAHARQALAQKPELTVTELAKTANVAWQTARRAKEAHNGTA